MNRLNKFFLPDNIEESRLSLATLTVNIVFFSLLASIGIIIVTFLNGDVESNRTFLGLGASILLTLSLIKLGRITLGAYLFAFLLWLAISFIVFVVGDGTKAVQILGYPILILMSTLLLGQRGAVLMTALSSISFVGIAYAHQNELFGTYELAAKIDPFDSVVAVITFVLVAAIQRSLYTNLTASLGLTIEQEKALLDTLDELRETQESLEETVERRTSQIHASAEVGRAATSLMDVDQIIGQTVQLISERFGYYYAAIFLNDNNRVFAELKDATGEGGRALLERGHRLQIGGNSMVGSAIATQTARIAHDAGDEPVRFDNPLLPKTRSEIALPLNARGQVLGALDVQSTEPEAFSEEDIEILQNMANQVAVAIENARLFQESESRLNELNRVYRQQFMETTRSISMKNNEIATNTLETIPDLDKILQEKSVSITHEGDRTRATIPLLSGGQVIGVLNMKSKRRRWTDNEVTIIESVSAQAAAALETARLVRDSQVRAERERVFSDTTARIRETLDMDIILKTAAEEIRKALGIAHVEVQIGPQATQTVAGPAVQGNGEPPEEAS